MRIISVKPGHDGHISYISNGQLIFSHEAEKDSGSRYAELDILTTLEAFTQLENAPEMVAISGWSHGWDPQGKALAGGYMGLDVRAPKIRNFMGSKVSFYTSSHERSHLICAYSMSPYAQGAPLYALVWEGHLGAFYSIDENLGITKIKTILVDPGVRFAFVYALSDPSFKFPRGMIRLGDAGKIMALAAFSSSNIEPTEEERKVLEMIMHAPDKKTTLSKDDFREFKIYNSGAESEATKRLARLVSDHIFLYFRDAITALITETRPLIISGGCGLNCDWNTAWENSGMFSSTFIPPCTNDTGSSIGTGVDAWFATTGKAKLEWSVYAGQIFVDDLDLQLTNSIEGFRYIGSEKSKIARALYDGAIIAWVNERCEIGPRALGNRSLLAAPFTKETLQRLNTIKKRETYRPIAPVCMEEDYQDYFSLNRPSPYMLYFSRVLNKKLKAVTHIDGSARPQTVNSSQNIRLHELLNAFKKISGVSVLCNTSLNFNGKGFINRSSDLIAYCRETGIDGFVINGNAFISENFSND
ncbi:carbamoyltransferase C-terminal domain-containing protein [Pseudomonas syringae]|uniref:carbamoyltransferase C-terminal domain-containing protein n=1 Tax=Pseudomonas syringae TaxID=317 RepID=UPI0003A17EA5